MKKLQSVKNIVIRATSVSLLATLAACGGGEEKPATDCLDNILILLLCSTFGSDNPAPTQNPVPSGASSSTGSSKADSGVSAVIGQVNEYEPNNVLDNANIVAFPGGAADASNGVEFNGSVQSTRDAADHFIFTPNRSGLHRIYLCSDSCNDSLEDDAAYIMLYDQNQTTIAATPVATVTPQEISADLTAGFAYYVEVNGYNAGGENYDYRLVVTD